MVSLVCLLTPPSTLPVGEGLINASGFLDRFSILVLSPKILPLLFLLLGSMAKTATFRPSSVHFLPKHSINVLLPTPGAPVILILSEERLP